MSLEPFGFTRTQNIVFWALVRRRDATGYALARDTGIARANVYHALEVLANRGLASSSGGRPSKYRAAGANACLALLAGSVQRQLAEVAQGLGVEGAGVHPTPQASAEQGALRSRSEAVGAVSACIATALSEVLAVTGPWVPEVLPALTEARRRGIAVRVVSLGHPAPEGALVRDVPRAELEAYWGGLPVLIVGDRAQAACAVIASDGVRGLATSNPGIVPFLRHLLRRELATAAAPRVS